MSAASSAGGRGRRRRGARVRRRGDRSARCGDRRGDRPRVPRRGRVGPGTKVLSFAPEHPLLGRPVCRAAGCSTTAPAASRICASCRRRLAEHGLGDDEIASLPPRGRQRSGRGPDACVVDGCRREWESASSGLCRAHAEQLRALPVADVDEFLAHRQTRPLPPCGPCAVAACTRQRRHPDGLYCEAHQQRLRTVRARDPHLDETRWRATEPAIGRGGEVSLRGLPPLVVAELLVGLQQRCRINAVKTSDAVLRAVLQRRPPPAGGLAGRLQSRRRPRPGVHRAGQLPDRSRPPGPVDPGNRSRPRMNGI